MVIRPRHYDQFDLAHALDEARRNSSLVMLMEQLEDKTLEALRWQAEQEQVRRKDADR